MSAVLVLNQNYEPLNVCNARRALVLVEGGEIRVWFGGGDVPHPAEEIHGQIGYGVLHIR